MTPLRTTRRSNGPGVLFDLDGTLVDPAGGITVGIAHALTAAGMDPPDEATLRAMVGPKLADALLTHTTARPEQIPGIIASYRQWYATTGMAMGAVYPGITDLLDALVDAGITLGVATQKPRTIARTILQTHGIEAYFDVVAGAPDEEALMPGEQGYTPGKTEIIAEALAALKPATAVMVGDRAQDVEGARANDIACLGAGWGYASPGELTEAGAALVVADPKDVTPGVLLSLAANLQAAPQQR
ncbi:HAD hydrolase-like protein (plasmid) [Arthrobacter sp. D3-18]